jgi:hypothetical protein
MAKVTDPSFWGYANWESDRVYTLSGEKRIEHLPGFVNGSPTWAIVTYRKHSTQWTLESIKYEPRKIKR